MWKGPPGDLHGCSGAATAVPSRGSQDFLLAISKGPPNVFQCAGKPTHSLQLTGWSSISEGPTSRSFLLLTASD